MLVELQNALVISVVLLGVVVGVELSRRRWGIDPEYTRKLAHLLSGVALVVVPWQLTTLWAPLLFTLGFFALMHLSKRRGWLQSVHGIARRSSGAVIFPVSVCATLLLAGGDPLLFKSAILVMALADSAAALVGRAVGRRRYWILDQSRTLEGSGAFFVVTLAVVFPALLGAGHSLSAAAACAVLVGLLVTAAEAISVGGLDNLVVPVSALLLIDTLAHQPAATLWTHVLVLLALLMGSALTFRRRGLTVAGSIAALLMGYAALMVGGLAFFAPLVVLYLTLELVASFDERDAESRGGSGLHNLRRVVSVLGLASLALLLYGWFPSPALYGAYLSVVAVALAVSWSARARALRRRSGGLGAVFLGSAAIATTLVVSATLGTGNAAASPGVLAVAGLASFAGFCCFGAFARRRHQLEAAALRGHAAALALYVTLFASLQVWG